jgi:hypothetical protein
MLDVPAKASYALNISCDCPAVHGDNRDIYFLVMDFTARE